MRWPLNGIKNEIAYDFTYQFIPRTESVGYETAGSLLLMLSYRTNLGYRYSALWPVLAIPLYV